MHGLQGEIEIKMQIMEERESHEVELNKWSDKIMCNFPAFLEIYGRRTNQTTRRRTWAFIYGCYTSNMKRKRICGRVKERKVRERKVWKVVRIKNSANKMMHVVFLGRKKKLCNGGSLLLWLTPRFSSSRLHNRTIIFPFFRLINICFNFPEFCLKCRLMTRGRDRRIVEAHFILFSSEKAAAKFKDFSVLGLLE